MPKFFCLLFGLILTVLAASCSAPGTSDVTIPADSGLQAAAGNSHQLWGYFQFKADPVAGTLDIVPLRDTAMHLNALVFLEPPPLVNLTLESLKFTGNIIDADIGLRHPFLGLTEFTGFDVCGIFITNGSVTGFSDPDLRMAGVGDTRLLNPDGYSRWWNPAEFPLGNTMFSYKDGLLGTPDSTANYNSTLNAYKYFCDDLTGPNDTLDKVTIAKRGLFSAGQKNIRHYKIELGGDGLIFNYAVDANWVFPTGSPPWTAPDDFAPSANRPEAWRIKVTELENTLWYENAESGGDLSLTIDVYDHFNADKNNVRIEATGAVPMTESASPIGGGAGYSTYQVDISDCTPSAAGNLGLFITIESDTTGYGGLLPGKPVSAYFKYTTQVDDEKPVGSIWSEEFVITDSNGRFPVIDQSPSGYVIAGWSSNPGIGWSKFTFPDTWATPGVVNSTYDMAWMSIEPGYSGNDICLHGGIYAGTTLVNGVQFEIGHPKTWRWDGATSWEFWDMNGGTALHSHYYNCFQNKHHILHGTYNAYGYPMHIQWTDWLQYYADYFQDYYDGSNMHEYGNSRCWDDKSNGYVLATYESDRMKGIFLPKIDYRYVKIAAQYLPSDASGDHGHWTIDEGANDYMDSPVVAIASNDRVHVAYRRYIDASSTWQIVHRWSNTGTSWSSSNETVVWSGNTEPEWRYISIDIDAKDRIHLTFITDRKILYTRSDDGINWLPFEWVNESIDGLLGVDDHQQWMFVDADNQVHVVWARLVVYPGTEFGAIRHRWRNALP